MVAIDDPAAVLAIAAAPFIGSFLATLAVRYPDMSAAVFGRSACPVCHRRLGALELIPLASWAIVRGRCRSCASAISPFYPLMELAAVLIPLTAAPFVSGWLLVASCVLGWCLLALSAIDARHYELPDHLTLPLIIGGLTVAALLEAEGWIDHVVGAAAGWATFSVMARGYRVLRGRDGLGAGDAKLFAASGAWLGWVGLPAVALLAAALGLVVTLSSAFARGERPDRRTILPFGPYLAMATWLVWFAGPVMFAP